MISICHKGDVVVSQDYGVAAMALGKGAYAIHQSGKWYTNENIDQMLMERHLNKKVRRSSHKNHMKGPRKRTEEDDVRFAQSFEKLILMAKSKRRCSEWDYLRKNIVTKTYDKENKKPVIKASMQIPLHRITDSASNGSVFPVVTEHFSASSDHAFL